MKLPFHLVSILTVMCMSLCSCVQSMQEGEIKEVVVFGTFSGFEDGKDVLKTPINQFGWFADEVKLVFVSRENILSRFSCEVLSSGYFSTILPAGEYSVHVQMPNRQVDLAHSLDAGQAKSANYLGHLHLEISRKNLFFLLGGCGYGSVESFSVENRFVKTKHLFELKTGKEVGTSINLVSPIKGKTPSVKIDCGFMR